MEKIKVENLSFTYPGESSPALSGINLSVLSGEFVTVCGKSGSGKSTLLRALKPSLTPHGKASGSVFLDGKRVSELTSREDAEKLGFVFQNPENQIVTDKVWSELAFGLESLSYATDEIRLRVAEMASFFGLSDVFHKNVSELSGGMKQTLALAIVMATSPEILILDEPTSRLDPIAAKKFLETVHRLNRELGVTVIISEHNLSEVFPLSDRVVVMEDGEISADSAPSEIGELLENAKSEMFLALPTPIQAYHSKKSALPCPITVREGRAWLSEMKKDEAWKSQDEPKHLGKRVLEVKDVFFRYEKNSRDVLRDFSVSINESEIYAIVGGNGAGKTTALSVIANIRKVQSGEVTVADGKKLLMLPQNPQLLFVRNTVETDLYEIIRDDKALTETEKKEKVSEMMELFGISHLRDRHPYDLSGGEQEKAALAKVLLASPDILLLDEPTKGLDAHFKRELGELFKELSERRITILMVTHDIEFAARYATRCGMFFDGAIVSEGEPREFFSCKTFYTTDAARMARGMLDSVLLTEDIISAIGGEERVFAPKKEKNFLSSKREESKAFETKKKTNKMSVALSCIIFLILIPLTVFFGMKYLDDRKYYFISILLIIETLIPFFVMFEKRKPRAKEIVIVAVMCALAVIGRVAFEAIPQFKPVAAIVIISGIMLGGESGFLVGALSAFVSNFFFGQTPFTPWQMFAFGLIGFISGILFRKGMPKNRIWVCLFGFFATFIIYGGILNPVSVILGQPNPTAEMFLTAYVTGFAFDIVHSLATATFLFFIAKPLAEKLSRIKKKYGI